MEVDNLSQPSTDSKNFAILTWIGMIFLGIIVPLAVYFIKTDDPFAREHAKASLNWSITALILMTIGGILSIILIGLLVIAVVAILNIVFGILGAVAANDSKFYTCPMTIKFLK